MDSLFNSSLMRIIFDKYPISTIFTSVVYKYMTHKDAKKEFHQKCVDSIHKSMENADKNLEILDSNKVLNDTYVKGSLLLLILPKWELVVFGEQYVVRATPYLKYTTAWIVPKKESDELDRKLQKVVLLSLGKDMSQMKIEDIERTTRVMVYEAINSQIPK